MHDYRIYTIFLAFLISITVAVPILKQSTLTASDLIRISPSTSSCDHAPEAAECRTAVQAASSTVDSFTFFGINDFYTQASLVALMLYESGDFKYSQNHFPGVPGQGTRSMQSPAYNLQYASFLSSINGSGITSTTLASAQNQGPISVLALVNTDRWSFASAAWYLTTQCSPTIREGLTQGTQAGWSAYLTQCIGTTATDDRTQVWKTAVTLGRWSS